MHPRVVPTRRGGIGGGRAGVCAAIAHRLHERRRQWLGKRCLVKGRCPNRRISPGNHGHGDERGRGDEEGDEDSPREGPDGDRRRERAPGRLRGVDRRGFDRTGWKPSSFHVGRRSRFLRRAAPHRQRDPQRHGLGPAEWPHLQVHVLHRRPKRSIPGRRRWGRPRPSSRTFAREERPRSRSTGKQGESRA